MNRLLTKTLFAFSAASLLLSSTTLSAMAASQQGQNGYAPQQGQQGQGGPGGFGGGPGGGRGGFGGFGGMMGGNRTLTAASVSLRLMASYLSLNDTQISKIALARDDMQEASRPTPPARGGGNGGDMQAMFAETNAKRQSAEKKTVAEIKAILTADQVAKLATLIKAMESLQTARIRPEAVGSLKLTDEQLTRIARGGTPESILSAEQLAIAETYRMPQSGPGGPGGPGGFGGPGQGGPGGPGGQGAPPPPPDQQIL